MFKWLAKIFNRSPTRVRYEVVQDKGNGCYQWGGELYKSDILRSCIQPHVSAIGKLTPVHVKAEGDEADYFYIDKVLREPNPYMAGCMLQEKLAAQLTLNRNAFAYINRDGNGYPIELYPLPVMSAEAIYDRGYNLYLRFVLRNGRMVTYPYRDVIHLRRDFYENDIFGTSAQEALTPLMELVGTSDKGLMDAIKNGAIIRWLVKWNQTIRPEDLKKQAENFAEMYLSTETNGTGVAATDAKAEVQQIKPNDYVPNVLQTDRTERRIYSFFGVNQNIVQNSYTEDEWNAFYEAQIEPVAKQMSDGEGRAVDSLTSFAAVSALGANMLVMMFPPRFPRRPATRLDKRKPAFMRVFQMVEMAGVEPASPGLSAETSTRLAARLDFGVS